MQKSIEQKQIILKQIDILTSKKKEKVAEKTFASTVIRENIVKERYSSKRNSINEGSTRPSKDFAFTKMLILDNDDDIGTNEVLLNTIIN